MLETRIANLEPFPLHINHTAVVLHYNLLNTRLVLGSQQNQKGLAVFYYSNFDHKQIFTERQCYFGSNEYTIW